jgi:hypothetical protein
MGAAWVWLTAHWLQVVVGCGVGAVVASTIATGLRKYPQGEPGKVRGWCIAALSIIAEVLSLVQHYDSQGSLKLPGARSNPPVSNEVNKGVDHE